MIIDMIMWFILLFFAHGIGIFLLIAVGYVLTEEGEEQDNERSTDFFK